MPGTPPPNINFVPTPGTGSGVPEEFVPPRRQGGILQNMDSYNRSWMGGDLYPQNPNRVPNAFGMPYQDMGELRRRNTQGILAGPPGFVGSEFATQYTRPAGRGLSLIHI